MNEERGADVIIVGAGLAGLTAASLLVRADRRVIVLEASARPGGRIQSLIEPTTGRVLGDLGPSWVWPPFQPIVAEWLKDLGAGTFDQYNTGNAVLDYGPGQPVQHQPLPGQHGMMRIDGGPQALVDGLLAKLPAGVLRTGQSVTSISQDASGVQVETPAELFSASHVIVAAPLRVARNSIRFSPALPDDLVREIEATPTWMAVHAKALAVYEKPFWREAGLSGRIASRAGPLVEAHDLCGAHGTPAALFGFVGWPHEVREQHRPHLKDAIIAQLVRCFGGRAANPVHLHVEDWAMNPYICSPLDRAGAMPHPDVGSPLLRRAYGRAQFAVSETSDISPGLIEGAFASGMRAASLLIN